MDDKASNSNFFTAKKMIFIILLICLLVLKMPMIARWSIEMNMTPMERAFAVFKTDAVQKCIEYIDENGMLWNYPEAYKEAAMQAVRDNFDGEKEEMYIGILSGGFSSINYMKGHTFDEFYAAITEMDLCIPEYYSEIDEESDPYIETLKNENNRDVLTDEEGNPKYYYEKVTYWWCLLETYRSGVCVQ